MTFLVPFLLSACMSDPPVISLVLAPDPVGTDDTLSAVIDRDEDVEVLVRWFLDGEERTDLTSWDVPATETTKGQEWMAIGVPFRGEVEGRPAWDAAVVANTAPMATVMITPENPEPGEALQALTTATDADDDAVAYEFMWARDGEIQDYARETIPEGVTALGETWSVSVIPKDPDQRGPTATDSVVVGVGTGEPVVYSVSLSPDPAYTTSTLLATVEASAAATQFTYTWVVNYVAVGTGSEATFSGDAFVKHDSVSVRVVGSDGLVTSSEVSSETLTIQNSPPLAPVVSITPASPVQGVDDLYCGLDAGSTDADEDAISYRFSWTGDGGVSADGYATTTHIKNDTILGETTALYSTWTCMVTPYDGETWGTAASATVTFGE